VATVLAAVCALSRHVPRSLPAACATSTLAAAALSVRRRARRPAHAGSSYSVCVQCTRASTPSARAYASPFARARRRAALRRIFSTGRGRQVDRCVMRAQVAVQERRGRRLRMTSSPKGGQEREAGQAQEQVGEV